jgi:photosystem II stability/assembly factor-like uncharacterized protein
LSKSSSGFWRRTLSRVTPAAFVSLSLCIVGLSAQQKAPQAAAEKVTAQEAPAQKPAAKKPAAKKPAAKKPAAKKPAAKKPAPFDLSKLDLRCLGPARMGGRVIDLAVVESRPSTFYVATASGGLWKTVNGGTTFAPVFESERTVSLGDVEIAPSDPKILWVGTGEANNRNSTSWGNGVYKSVDAGKSWKHMGLPKSYHIGAIAIHPTNPDIVFVAACGDLWAPNPERGLYRTQDGGKSWELVLKRDEFTGATEVCIDPSNPDVIFAALYERQRDGFDTNDPKKRWGPGSGLFKSTDGGDNWRKLSNGLPTVQMGRIALDIYRKDPKVIYALIETELIGTLPEGAEEPEPEKGQPAFMGINAADGKSGETPGAELSQVTEGGPAFKAGLRAGDLVVAMAGKKVASYDELIAGIRAKRSGDKVPVDVLRKGKKQSFEMTFGSRRQMAGGGRSPVADRIHGQIANRMKMQGPKGFETGGTYRSDDGGETWSRVNSLNPRPYYFSRIRVDPSDDNWVWVCGISFHRSEDGGKRFYEGNAAPSVHVDHHALWINPRDGRHMILGCDGGVNVTWDRGKTWETFANMSIGQAYHAEADNRRPYWVYAGYQDNGSWGSPSETHYREGITNYDAFKIGSGDGFVCRVDRDDPNVVFYESQGGNIGWRNVMTGQGGRLRRTPTEMGAQLQARAGQRGQQARAGQRGQQARGQQARGQQARGQQRAAPVRWNWNTPYLLSHYNQRSVYYAGSRVFKSPNRGRDAWVISKEISLTERGSATALSESPRSPGLLWVGTDDGAIHVTSNDGAKWTAVHAAVHDQLPNKIPLWVSHIAASAHNPRRAYLSLDGHRLGDRNAYVFVTEDLGKTWKSISMGLPEDSVHCIHEDEENPDLLYVGTEMGLWVSIDRGASWMEVPHLPTVAVHDLDQQNREEHLILGTHGRSVWVLDIRPLRRLTRAERAKSAVLVQPNDILRLRKRTRSMQGSAHFMLPNPPDRAEFYYWLGLQPKAKVTLEVRDLDGNVVSTLKGAGTPGLHRADWSLVRRIPGQRGRGGRAPAGTYAVTLRIGKDAQTRVFKIEDDDRPLDTSLPRGARIGEGRESLLEESADEESSRKGADGQHIQHEQI